MRRHRIMLSPVAALLIMTTILGGCFFKDLKNDLADYDASYALVGTILSPHTDHSRIIVILFTEEDGRQIPVRYTFPEETGHFSFLVEAGTYYLKAFEDLNENLDHDPGEYAGEYGDPINVVPVEPKTGKKAGRTIENLNIRLSPAAAFLDGLDSIDNLAIEQMPVFKLGKIANFDDPLFQQDNGSTGYWKPFSFIKQFGVGIYFLEPYDSERIPVLFVHGAVGTPIGWKDLAEGINERRYQSWFYFYPSGIRLDVAANILNGLIQTLHEKYRFDNLYITAHSMGGLVSRAAILKNHYQHDQRYIKLFVSLSTPWGGVRMAQVGAEKAPTAIPSWHDIAPDSEFIRGIYSQSLPPDIPFHLFFSYKGTCSKFMENNDGTVELQSQLDYRAQSEAAEVYGLYEDHDTILSSSDTVEQYRAVLNSARIELKHE